MLQLILARSYLEDQSCCSSVTPDGASERKPAVSTHSHRQHMSRRLTLEDIKRCRNVPVTQCWPQRQNLWNMSQNLQLLTSGSDQPPLVSIGSKSDNTLTSAEDLLQVQPGSLDVLSEDGKTQAWSEEPNQTGRTTGLSQLFQLPAQCFMFHE